MRISTPAPMQFTRRARVARSASACSPPAGGVERMCAVRFQRWCSSRRLPAVPRAVSAAASHVHDGAFLGRAADVADRSAGLTCPHPNFGCVIARPEPDGPEGGGPGGRGGVPLRAGHALRRAPCRRGGRRARRRARPRRHRLPQPRAGRLLRGQHRRLLPRAGITRVVVGLRHPLKHLRGKAIQSLRSEGIQVDVVGEDLQSKLFKARRG